LPFNRLLAVDLEAATAGYPPGNGRAHDFPQHASEQPPCEGMVAQHATDILASCTLSNATNGLTNKIPGAGQMASIP
jgi:hypothetical protein